VRCAAFCFAFLALSMTCSRAFAQGNFHSSPTGGRSALMGGTGYALGRDGAAPFLNPSTIVRIDDSGLAFSVNFYQFQSTHLTNVHQPGPVDPTYGKLTLPDTNLDNSRFDQLPSSLCLFLTIGNWGDNAPVDTENPHRKGRSKVAGCFGNVERQALDGTAAGYTGTSPSTGGSSSLAATQALSLSQHWNRLFVGPTFSKYVTDNVSLGLSIHVIETSVSNTWSVGTIVTDGHGFTTSSTFDRAMNSYSVDVGVVGGLMWHLDRHQTLGVSVSTPTAHVLGQYQATTNIQTLGSAQYALVKTATGDFEAPVPIRIGLGLGEEVGRLRFEGDVSAYLPVGTLATATPHVVQTAVIGGGLSTSSYDTKLIDYAWPVVDAAIGAEWFTSPGLSFLGGLSTDLSAVPPLPDSPPLETVADSRLQRVAASFGIGSYGDGSELLLGTELSLAFGKTLAVDSFVDPPRFVLADRRSFGAMLIIAGGASITAFKRTLANLTDIVKVPPPKK
jgi:hypothetical protein